MLQAPKTRQAGQSGFTLIELSIVLVIIGLIVGGVLVGQDLIKAAELRATITQIERYNTSVNTFRNKYNGFPGDLSTAATFFNFTDVANGNGDGLITDSATVSATASQNFDSTPAAAAADNEIMQFFPMLSAAGLIDGSYVVAGQANAIAAGANFPAMKSGRAGIMPIMVAGQNFYHLGISATAANAPVFSNAAFTPSEALQIDTKLDDAAPDTGIVTGRYGATAALIAVAGDTPGVAKCLDTASTYNVAAANGVANSPLCQLRIRASF